MAGKKRKANPGVLKDIPYVRCYVEAGMIEVSNGSFTHTYEIIPPYRAKEMTYSARKTRAALRKIFGLFGDMSFQFVIRNNLISREEYLKRIQLPMENHTAINGIIESYNSLLAENVDIGHNNYESRVYLTVTVSGGNAGEAAERFENLDELVGAAFGDLYGYSAKPLSLSERLALLGDIYHQGERKDVNTSTVGKRRRKTTKEQIAPESISYERTYIEMSGKYIRMLFMNVLPGEIPDSLLCDLTAVSGNSIVSVSYEPLDSEVGLYSANSLVEANTSVETIPIRDTVADRREGRMKTVKKARSENEEEYFNLASLSLFRESAEKEEPVILTTIIIALISDSRDELERDSTLLKLAAYKYGCQIRTCDLLQREAFQSVLPLNYDGVHFKRAFGMEKISAVLPINVQKLFETRPMFQGLNMINDNMIFADRRSCPVGLITGIAHSGKTFAIKRDAMNALMTTEDRVFILTEKPEEYRSFMERGDGGVIYHTPDPFAKDESYALTGDAGVLKQLFLTACMTVASGYYRKKYLSAEKAGIRTKIMQEAQMLVYQGFDAIEDVTSYVKGKEEAFSYFLAAFGNLRADRPEDAGRLNIVPCENDLMKLVMLDYLWNVAIAERKRNKNVWIYVDGADEFLYSTECSDYLLSVMDLAAKLQVPLTLVLDDAVHIVTDQDASIEADYFVKKVAFFKFLSMGPIERKWFTDRLNINQTLVPYMTDREPGEGILITPTLNVAFTDRFDAEDSEFYQVFRG